MPPTKDTKRWMSPLPRGAPGSATSVVSLPSPDGVASAHRYADASRAASTRDTYTRAWDAFDAWSGGQGLSALPAHPGTVAVYLACRAEVGLSPSALTVALAAIGWVHRQSGRQPPQKAKGGVSIADVIAGIRRAHGLSQQRKTTAAAEALTALLAAIKGDGLRETKDGALLAFGMAACLCDAPS